MCRKGGHKALSPVPSNPEKGQERENYRILTRSCVRESRTLGGTAGTAMFGFLCVRSHAAQCGLARPKIAVQSSPSAQRSVRHEKPGVKGRPGLE